MSRRFLTLWLALNALALIFAGQTWWHLQINTGDQNTVVNGSGFDADRSISAFLMFTLAALLFVAFSRGWAAVVISAFAAAASVLLVVFTSLNFLSQNIGGIANSIEKHTGIAIEPILAKNLDGQVSGQLEVWAWLALVTMAALATVQITFALRYRSWSSKVEAKGDRTVPKQAAGTKRSSKDKPYEVTVDAISLWDSQRD